ncbi:MAG: glycosyltransferase [Paludibacteraceae bacterium]|nr:glycosyltransferase [Paludibacteraceae bacterium]
MLKLSIIVPVYNVSKYLAKCLDSLLVQDLMIEEYEIIVVNDGSTDNSGEIAKEYADKYSNIILINQENQGLSGARNTGIKVAQGKYIQFVDSDDYLEPNVLKTLVDKMDGDSLDVLRFNYQNVNENYEVYEPYKEHKPFVDYRDEICDGLTFLTERLGYGCYAWQFIIKTDIFTKDGNLFKPGIYFEDTEWTPRILTQTHRVTSTEFMVYNYLLRSGSITNSVSIEKKRKVLDDKMALIQSLKEQMSDKSDKRWYEGMISATVVSIVGIIVTDFYDDKDKILKKLKSFDVFPLSKYHLSKSQKKKIALINISSNILCWLLHILYKFK